MFRGQKTALGEAHDENYFDYKKSKQIIKVGTERIQGRI